MAQRKVKTSFGSSKPDDQEIPDDNAPAETQPEDPKPAEETTQEETTEKESTDTTENETEEDVSEPEAPAESPATEADEELPIVAKARADLEEITTTLETRVNSLKAQGSGAEPADLMRLGAAKFLREAASKAEEMEDILEEMKKTGTAIRVAQQGLDKSTEYINERSITFRTERDAFVKLRSLTDREYYELIAEINARTQAEKEKAEGKEEAA